MLKHSNELCTAIITQVFNDKNKLYLIFCDAINNENKVSSCMYISSEFMIKKSTIDTTILYKTTALLT